MSNYTRDQSTAPAPNAAQQRRRTESLGCGMALSFAPFRERKTPLRPTQRPTCDFLVLDSILLLDNVSHCQKQVCCEVHRQRRISCPCQVDEWHVNQSAVSIERKFRYGLNCQLAFYLSLPSAFQPQNRRSERTWDNTAISARRDLPTSDIENSQQLWPWQFVFVICIYVNLQNLISLICLAHSNTEHTVTVN